MASITEQIMAIRGFINSPRKNRLLSSQLADWNKLCSSLDAIEDTESAIGYYLRKVDPVSIGETYLLVYGILQVLFVQQDAVKHIAESLGIQYEIDRILSDIREIRNDSVGHPTMRGHGKGASFNRIVQSGMRLQGFSLFTTYADDAKPRFSYVNIPDLIKGQRTRVFNLLNGVIKNLQEEEMAHRKEFRDEKLAIIFPHTIDYFCEKIYETIDGGMPDSFGASMVDTIKEHLSEFREALNRRNLLEALTSVKYHLDLVVYPLEKLKTYFVDRQNSGLNKNDADIFTFFVRSHLNDLHTMATEIDSEYATDI